LGKNVFDFIDNEDKKQAIKLIENQKNESVQNIEFRFITKNRKEVWTSIASNSIYNEEGKYKGALAMVTDVTEKKEVEKQREFDRNNLNALINNTNDLMWSVDKDFNLITSNQPFDEMSKISFGKVIGKGNSVLSVAYTDEMRNHFKQFYERAFKGETFTEIEHFISPVEYWTEISYYPIRRGNEIIGTACHSRDITNIKMAENKLRNSANQIRNFAKHLNKVQEEERGHFARELHDELGQQLAGIKMGLSLITMLKDKDKMIDKAKYIAKDVDEAINSMRKVATELRPGILDSLGLVASLEWLAEEFERKKGIKCIVKANVKESKFEKSISTCFFRVCQESLTNIFKHADASEVNINLDQNEHELVLTVIDNGNGISSDKLDNPFSMGLLGMKERASIIGADLTVSSKNNLGTIIKLRATLK
jgi:PAS domain S-box-containing protein